ncbi:hypothetical protein KFK09_007494 [Dendrobium nobile]|uniref:Uncharacterized protein n=1 Tax=Dendrobium nobile TaxID=94219 RepID=A0A8T3BUH6_DENNO|nr:hypothetical protein KFK09_007494 [Dendrobium nobile]
MKMSARSCSECERDWGREGMCGGARPVQEVARSAGLRRRVGAIAGVWRERRPGMALAVEEAGGRYLVGGACR